MQPRSRKTPDWYIEQRPCPGADPSDVYKLVQYVMQDMVTDFALGNTEWAKECGLATPNITDPRLRRPELPPAILDRLNGLGRMGDDDSAEPGGEGSP